MNIEHHKEFYLKLEALRRNSGQIDLTEIARLALKAGLRFSEALLEIRNQQAYRPMRYNEMADALSKFISSICDAGKSRNILEYVGTTSLLTACLFDEEKYQITYISPNQIIVDVLKTLLVEQSFLVIGSIKKIPHSMKFDAIVFQPSLGQRPTGNKNTDGWGGEVIRDLIPFLADSGTLYWVTGRGVLFNPRPKQTLTTLQTEGLQAVAAIEVAPGAFVETMIEGAIIALRRQSPGKRFLGSLRDLETAELMASAFIAGPSRKSSPNWIWLDAEDQRTFTDVEQVRLLQKLMPRGRHTLMSLGSLLTTDCVEKADKVMQDGKQPSSFLFFPEYAVHRVTTEFEEQTSKPSSVYRLDINQDKVNPRFLAWLLNCPFGKQLRASVAHGAMIQRISGTALKSIELPIPDMITQSRIAYIDSDIGLLQAELRDRQSLLDQDWAALPDVEEKIDELKSVLDIERQIADWWRELPYPLATIYRLYKVSTDPKERLDTLLHFFEMAAVYLAAIGTSHVKAMREDWQNYFAEWFHPTAASGIERTDFGFWNKLAGASLKDIRRITSDKDLRAKATEISGPELIQVAESIGSLGKATEILDVARHYRNSWKGHGGHVKASDAKRLDDELQPLVRDLYEKTAPIFRRFHLVRPGKADFTDTGMIFQVENLTGSDPTFEKKQIELYRPAKSNALAFWMRDAKVMCRALPFFRLGAPQQPQETSFYVFNRIENGGCRWICYQESQQQEFIAPDEELLGLIALRTEIK